MSSFAWQSNKALLCYFTQNSCLQDSICTSAEMLKFWASDLYLIFVTYIILKSWPVLSVITSLGRPLISSRADGNHRVTASFRIWVTAHGAAPIGRYERRTLRSFPPNVWKGPRLAMETLSTFLLLSLIH